jgi:protocatechuate 3,4-dioxygenase beta subunit
MRLLVHLAIVSALLLCGAGLCPRANSQTTPPKKNPDATVSGKVTIKGKPAPGVVVGLRSSQPGQFDQTFKATTDQDGIYRITDVPAGSFEVAPVAPAFVISDVNSSSGQTVVINEAENVEGIDFDLVRGGVITGKVTDTEGHPVIEERITLSPVDPRNQRGPVYSGARMNLTDDRGIYRLFGVRPGRYRVSAGEGDTGYYGSVGSRRFPHPTIFYADATDPAKATVVEIAEGTEATSIDITLGQSPQGFSVNGRVVDGETGKPVANVAIGLSKIVMTDPNNSRSYGGGTGVRSDSRGEFRLENLAPGKYSVTAYPPQESNFRADAVTFDVLDQEVTGLLIKSSVGASVSGTVVIEGSKDNRAVAALAQAFVAAYVVQSPSVTSGHSARINRDGSFQVGGLQAGTVNFSLDTMDNIKGLNVTRVERDGVVQPGGIQIQNGEQATGIRIVVAYSNGSIRGVIKTENGTLPSGGRLIIQLMKPGEMNGYQQTVNADSRGHFLIEGLAAGSYELRILAYVPESRQRTPSAKQLVTVTDGAATEVTVTIDLAATPGP